MKEINIEELNFNPFSKIGKEWFLITSGNREKYNTMTASWGFMGVMWNKNCVQAVVRPTRHTFELLQENDTFTVSFYPDRDVDKAKETGLTPVFDGDHVYFGEAKLVLCCKKIYVGNMDANAVDPELNKAYNSKDPIHTQFIGEIVKVLEK